MTRPLHLLYASLGALVLGLVAAFISSAWATSADTTVVWNALAMVLFILAGLLAVGAGLAKVIQIGVRSGHDD